MKKIISLICTMLLLSLTVTPAEAAAKDTKAPTVTKTNPAADSADHMIEGTIVIRFSENILKGKSFSKITVKAKTTGVKYTGEITGNLLKLTPGTKLKYNTAYTVTIPAAAVKDKAGNELKKAYIFNFVSEKDPAKEAAAPQTAGKIKYRIELEAYLDHELTKRELEDFVGLLQMLGVEAKIIDYHKVTEE